jgi:ribokinase
MGRVVVVGSVHQRVVVDVPRIPGAGETATSLRTRRSLGGSGMLQAAAARRWGAEVALVAAVGDDETGRWCRERLVRARIVPRLQVVAAEPTGLAIVAREDGDRDAVILVPGADTALRSRAALDDTAPDDVVLIQLDVPPAVVADVLREADHRQLRVVVNASPYATVDPEAAALADPLVVGERDAAILADVGLMPRSLCVTFGWAGAVWDGLRIDSGDLGSPALAPGGTEAFCGTLAAALAAGCDRLPALRAAVAAAGDAEVAEDDEDLEGD